MKRKFLSMVILMVAVVLLTACGSSNNQSRPPEANNTTSQPTAVPYKVAGNYFVRNDVDASALISQRLDTQGEFNQYFGMATTMGSEPTPIDFNSQFVIAVISPPTDRVTRMKSENLTHHNGVITLSYSRKVGERQSFSIRHALIVVVDRQYNGEVLVVEK